MLKTTNLFNSKQQHVTKIENNASSHQKCFPWNRGKTMINKRADKLNTPNLPWNYAEIWWPSRNNATFIHISDKVEKRIQLLTNQKTNVVTLFIYNDEGVSHYKFGIPHEFSQAGKVMPVLSIVTHPFRTDLLILIDMSRLHASDLVKQKVHSSSMVKWQLHHVKCLACYLSWNINSQKNSTHNYFLTYNRIPVVAVEESEIHRKNMRPRQWV